MISIVVPVLNEERALPGLLASLQAQEGTFEIVVVDGGSSDNTAAVAEQHPGVLLVRSPKGRARQMNAGAAAARGDVLLFLHADTRLPTGAIALLQDSTWQAGCFTHRFQPNDWRLRLVSALHNTRCRLTRVYYGDQAIFVRRALFDRVGGYPEVPVLEDVILCERLRPLTRAVMLPEVVETDSRRFLHHGVWRSSAHGIGIMLRHWFGRRQRLEGNAFIDEVR